MKKKISKILGVGLALVLVASMLVFAIPVSAGPYDDLTPAPVAHTWVGFLPTPGSAPPGFWFYMPNIYGSGPVAEALDGDLLCAVTYYDPVKMTYINDILMSSDGGRTWSASTAPGAYPNLDENDGTPPPVIESPGAVVDMVCSSLYEDVAYATDGNYVFKTIDGGNNWSFVNMNSLETVLCGDCGPSVTIPSTCDACLPACGCSNLITSIDVGYDSNDSPVVFIGTTWSYATGYGTVFWIADESWPAVWTDMDLSCYGTGQYCVYAVGCVPNFATNTKAKIYIAITDPYKTADETWTQILSSTGGVCDWTFVAGLYWDCDGPEVPLVNMNNFTIMHASRFAFSESFESNATMFLGVADAQWCTLCGGFGGDVYRIVDAPSANHIAIDLNVSGFTSGCLGKWPSDIWSLDIKAGDALIAGAAWRWDQDPTNVYYSNDAGWTWAESKKDPTGSYYTSVIWYDETALAATWDCNCGFSMSCGDTIGEYWNQISLIQMDIDETLDLAHAPGYLDGSSTMYVQTKDDTVCVSVDPEGSGANYDAYITNLLRWDGTYWERVYSSLSYNWVPGTYDTVYGCPNGSFVNWPMDWVECSPDFNQTSAVYQANTDFEMYRSMDQGCSWVLLTYPCSPRPDISAWIVVDSETVLTAGAGSYSGTVYKTTYHGAQPWEEYLVPSAGPFKGTAAAGVDFDLSPNIANDTSVLFGDAAGNVFLSQDLGETWDEIMDAITKASFNGAANTYVVFDPGFGTSGDPGENMIYAAAGTKIGRCDIDFDALMSKQHWVYIDEADLGCVECDLTCASGIAVAGDTALYVADTGGGLGLTVRKVTVSGQVSVDWTGDLWIHVLEDDWGLSVELPVQGTIDLVGATVSHEQGEFNDGEVVTHISDVLTATGDGNRYWTLGFEGLDDYWYNAPDYNLKKTPGGPVPIYGDGTTTTFSFTLYGTVTKFSLYLYDSDDELGSIYDKFGDGTLVSDYTWTGTTWVYSPHVVGSIDYITGAGTVTFETAPLSGGLVYAYYSTPERVFFYSMGNGVSGKIFVPPSVQVDVMVYNTVAGFGTPSTTAGTYDPVTGYFTLDAPTYHTTSNIDYPYLRFLGTGFDGYAYIFVPASYPIDSFWGNFWGMIMPYMPDPSFPFPTVTGTIGVRGSYTGATGDITLLNQTVWLPPTVWKHILHDLDAGFISGDSLAEWFTGVGFNVVSTDLVTDVTPGVAADTVIPTGVWRSLNPMDPMPPDVPVPFVEWEFLDLGTKSPTSVIQHPEADAFGVYPDDLWLTAASNMLWVLDAAAYLNNYVPPVYQTTKIWMFDDDLATPVTGLSPASGTKLVTDTMATLSWDALDKATLYEIELYSYCPACPDEKEKVLDPVTDENFTSKDDCITFTDLTPGTKYYWRVRVACDSPYLSKWSAEYTFDTAMGAVPYLCSPWCGQTDVILTPNFSWDPVTGATGYEVEVADNEDFSPVIASGSVPVNAWVTDITLNYSTTYYWRVRAIKDGVAGAWAVCIFTTEAAPAAAVTPTQQVVQVTQEEISPVWIWVIIGIGAALVIAVVILIVMTRRPA